MFVISLSIDFRVSYTTGKAPHRGCVSAWELGQVADIHKNGLTLDPPILAHNGRKLHSNQNVEIKLLMIRDLEWFQMFDERKYVCSVCVFVAS